MIHYRQHMITSAISLYFLEICTQCRRKLEEASLIESPTPESTKAPIAEHKDQEEEVSFIKSITLCSPWTELRVLSQFIKIFKLYITRLKNIKSY